MASVKDRFLKYVSFDTQSQGECEQVPSTEKQLRLAEYLVEELKGIGAQDVELAEHGYVYATIPATAEEDLPVLGFIAHMDTSDALSGAGVKPRLIENYDGGDIVLNEEKNIVMEVKEFGDLAAYAGKTLIVTDGTTLLGADDKAGIAEIMTMAEELLAHPEIRHGKIRIGFTPDEEVGRGVDFFDVEGFGADYAYTVDGGALGEVEYENFNAASGKVRIHGLSIHPGGSKGKMVNALLIGMEFQSLLPVFENPICTEGYEGFFHLDNMAGSVEEAELNYIIRDHCREKFERKKAIFESCGRFLNEKYGDGTVEVLLRDSYYNMKEMIEPNMHLIETAKEAMAELGVEPIIIPIRGGTDGARLSYMGLPCPNLCTGGHNCHGKFEYISLESMGKCVELLHKIVEKYARV